MIPCNDEQIFQKMCQAHRLWLFLDYDGTLADFAPTPEVIIPDESVISLIHQLADHPDIQVSIISGRRLSQLQRLLPVRKVLMAGTYGLELHFPDGESILRIKLEKTKPLLVDLKKKWTQLLAGHSDFYLEDKTWTLAIHAKDADEFEAAAILQGAREQAELLMTQDTENLFRLQGGYRFLECSPRLADKRRTVEYLLSAIPHSDDTLLIYLGDDDKDEVAFSLIQEYGGVVGSVGERLKNSGADFWLPSPQAVRHCLQAVVAARN
jgi:trehalose 6-phosphate phosphatase